MRIRFFRGAGKTRLILAGLIAAAMGSAGSVAAGPAESTVHVAGFNYQVVMCGVGSGFVSAPETVITAKHVADMGTSLRVRDAAGRWHNATVRATGKPDWAVLDVPGLRVEPLPADLDGVQSGEPLTAYGRFKDGLRMSGGNESRWMFQGDYGFSTTKVYPGYSGGPIVDGAGKVVGVVSMQTPSGSCLYVPVSAIR